VKGRVVAGLLVRLGWEEDEAAEDGGCAPWIGPVPASVKNMPTGYQGIGTSSRDPRTLKSQAAEGVCVCVGAARAERRKVGVADGEGDRPGYLLSVKKKCS
jgi:hypothetical protein